MNILNVYDKEFRYYGQIINGYDNEKILREIEKTPLPTGRQYMPSDPKLEKLPVAKYMELNQFGGMPIQIGWCNGHNSKLNCLEYHRSSEINISTEDVILLLARMSDMENGILDTKKIKAFLMPRGVMVEIYGSILHYAPCHIDAEKGYRMMVVLPQGTNTPKTNIEMITHEDKMLRGKNKWLIVHADAPEAAQGAYVGLSGENIEISDYF